MLNLLYIENQNAQIAVKVNSNKLSRRINVTNVEMQGSVWSSLKCTTLMDKLNQMVMKDESLQYFYKNDKNVPIGIRGMVDDTLGIQKCGNSSIKLNSVINSFIESQRLTLSKEKSVVIHVGKKHRCVVPCPNLKVHNDKMHEKQSTKYLGNLITSNGGVRETVEDRRNKGWGKVAQIKAILQEVPFGSHRVEAGLLLRRSILVNSLLFSAETWSGVTERDIARMQVVDTALIRSITGGHSKTAVEFHFLETGSLMLKHILRINRMMYHHDILNRKDDETVKKMYKKQTEVTTKGDWFQLIKKDFAYIGTICG